MASKVPYLAEAGRQLGEALDQLQAGRGAGSTQRERAPAGHPHVEGGAGPSSIAQPPPATISPLVHLGLVLNVDTGKTIKIGKGTYKRLLDAGYVMDPVAGTITAPPAGAHMESGAGRSVKSRGSGNGNGRRRRSRSSSWVMVR